MEYKNFTNTLEIKAEGGAIEGYAATFGNVDNVGDVILSGAFSKSLLTRKPKMLWQHDSDDIIGVWNEAFEDLSGLLVKGIFANTQCGNEARELAKIGAVTEMSIGYSVSKASYRSDGIRVLEELDLYEVSLVTFPANDKAKITRVKSSHKNERDFENFLREAGYSREAAKIVVSKGFKALNNQCEADNSNAELVADFRKFTQLFTKE
jgi:HK97 family phage prohead protease